MEKEFRWEAVYRGSAVQTSFEPMEYVFRQLKSFMILKDMHQTKVNH